MSSNNVIRAQQYNVHWNSWDVMNDGFSAERRVGMVRWPPHGRNEAPTEYHRQRSLSDCDEDIVRSSDEKRSTGYAWTEWLKVTLTRPSSCQAPEQHCPLLRAHD